MSKTIQIRNVPEAVHRRLRLRAIESGMSLSEHLLAEVMRVAELPTRAEMRERLQSRSAVKLGKSAAALVRRERDSA